MNSNLKDQTVLVTGASGGIGRAAAWAFAEEGASLVLHYHSNEASARVLQSELAVESLVVKADLREETEVDAMFAAAIERFATLHAIVVNAGIWPSEDVPIGRMSLDRWEETLRADLTSAFLTCRAFVRHLEEVPREEASIVLIGSTAALFGEAGHGDYSAAKAGMAYGLTRTLKNEIVRVAPRGRVNAICPGWTNTRMAAGTTADPGAIQRTTRTMALRKIAEPEDIASAIVFLTSSKLSGHLSGAILPIAGGMEGRTLHEF